LQVVAVSRCPMPVASWEVEVPLTATKQEVCLMLSQEPFSVETPFHLLGWNGVGEDEPITTVKDYLADRADTRYPLFAEQKGMQAAMKAALRSLAILQRHAARSGGEYAVRHREDNVLCWDLVLKGPPLSAYEGGFFHLSMNFGMEYPFKPPEIKLLTKIFHPNMGEAAGGGGTWPFYCQNLNGSEFRDRWNPALMRCLHLQIKLTCDQLADVPGATQFMHVQMGEAYEALQRDYTCFEATAKEWTAAFAGPEGLPFEWPRAK